MQVEGHTILNSWKEIAVYMGRGVRTVQRWEQDCHLPVHRPRGRKRSPVFAFAAEIDLWLEKCPVGINATADFGHINSRHFNEPRTPLPDKN